jgi:NADP-dependent 3-hydroxy acid dehydrogenase YdfG
MVTTPAVIQNNARFAKEQHTDAVCVFAGATKGIGLATLKKLAAMLYSSTFYVLGRSPSGYANLLDQLKQAGPSNSYIFIEVQVSLISSVDAACLHIASMENKVDYICMSTGGMPWQGAVCKT